MPRFRRRRFTRRRRPFRLRRRVRRVSRKKLRLKRSRRKQRAKSFLYGYSGATHVDATQGTIQVAPIENQVADSTGLFNWRDIQEICEQVRNVDDLIWASQGSSLLSKARRINLRVRAKGEQTFYISNGNAAGAVWLEVYVCKPRKGISTAGIGAVNDVTAPAVINNNRNSAFFKDYKDGTGLSLSGATPPLIQNQVDQIAPTINNNNFVFTPYMCPPFTENWKVIKQHKYVLPPGGQCMFKIKTRFLTFNRQVIQPLSGDGTSRIHWGIFRPSFGIEVFVRFHGQPVHAGTEQARTVNFGAAAIDVVNTKKYWYSHATRPLPSYYLDSNINQGDVTKAELPANPANPVADTPTAP